MRLAGKLEALYRDTVSLFAARLSDAERWEDALHWAWVALRVGEIVPSDESERVGRVVLEAAAKLHDVERLRGEYGALQRRLEECGVEMSALLEQRYTDLHRSLAAQGEQESRERPREQAAVAAGGGRRQ
jgi:hypothetical protein